MKWFSTRKKQPDETAVSASPGQVMTHPFSAINGYVPLRRSQLSLYASLREAVPVIDAAISKLRRLIGNFQVVCGDERAQHALEEFLRTVKVGGMNRGFSTFLDTYFDQLLTFGTAVGEIVFDESETEIAALYNASLEHLSLKEGDTPLQVKVLVQDASGEREAPHQERIVFSLLNPKPGSNEGVSILKGLEFVSSILLKVFGCMGQNFERVGNVRFAVTCKPPQNGTGISPKRKAEEIAKEWQKAMRSKERVCDFVSVGDIQIKAIGADNQVLEFEAPIRALCEQVVAKLSIPPFMLGLSWSTTERMSTQQADILMSELEHYRSLLTPMITQVAQMFLDIEGYDPKVEVRWEQMKLQDLTEGAQARLLNAQADKIYKELNDSKTDAEQEASAGSDLDNDPKQQPDAEQEQHESEENDG